MLAPSTQPGTQQKVALPELAVENATACAFAIRNCLFAAECEALINASEGLGFDPLALVNIGFGRQAAMPDARSASRCVIESDEIGRVL